MKFGVLHRLLLSLTLLFLVSTGFIAYSLIDVAENAYEEARLHQANNTAEGLANGSLDALAVKDYELIEGWLNSTQAIDDFAYAYLSKDDGQIISHTNYELVGHQAESRGAITSPVTIELSYLNRPVREVVHSAYLGSKHLANAHLAYYTDSKSFYTQEIFIKIFSVLLLTLLVLSLVTYFLLHWVLKPIEKLAVAMKTVTKNKNYGYRVNKKSTDEIGLLVSSFNNMLEQIQYRDNELISEKENAIKSENESRIYAHEVSMINNDLESEISERIKIEYELKELSETLEQRVKERTKKLEELNKIIGDVSRSAGMAEIANGVIHNVGNVLNSVNVSSSVIRELVRSSSTESLKKVVDMLNHNKNNIGEFMSTDDKGTQIPRFLELLVDMQGKQDVNINHELNDLDKNINHIKNIITMQQSYSGSFGVTEHVNMIELVEDAININLQRIQNHGLKIVKNISLVDDLQVDRHKILQIIINLISNAIHALIESINNDKLITISVSKKNELIEFEIKDTGIGILAEDLPDIFKYGFTKRKNGHGYGLHNSALLAKDVGGNISVKSEGVNHGAIFTFVFKESKDN